MSMRLHPRAKNAEADWWRREMQRCESSKSDRGDGRGPHLRDQTPIHHSKWFARRAAQELDRGHVRGNATACVARVERNRLYGHEFAGDDRHDGEPAVLDSLGVAGAQDRARRLLKLAGRVRKQRLPDGGNELLIRERGADFRLGDVQGRPALRDWIVDYGSVWAIAGV